MFSNLIDNSTAHHDGIATVGNLPRLFSFKALRRLLDEMTRLSDPARSEANRKLLDELIPDRVPMDLLHKVLRLLLEEQVSIRNMPLILEAISEARLLTTQAEGICEHVRQRLGFQLVSSLTREDGSIPLVQLAPEWEETFAAYQMDGDGGAMDVALPPDLFNTLAGNLAEKLGQAIEQGIYPAVVTSTRRRRFLRTVLTSKGIRNSVLAYEEIGARSKPYIIGVV